MNNITRGKNKIGTFLDLVSYPRSGSNWVKYFIQNMTKLSVADGTARPDISKNEFGKNHGHEGGWFKLVQEAGDSYRQILIVRNYKECLYRFNARSYNEFVDKLTYDARTGVQKTGYMCLLQIFDDLKVPKLMIYYEDLLKNPEEEFGRLHKFLSDIDGITFVKHLEIFFNSLPEHIQKSLDWCMEHIQLPVSSGKPIFHSLNLRRELLLNLDSYLEEHYLKLYNKYLSRYKEE